jgi:hypothetical protein
MINNPSMEFEIFVSEQIKEIKKYREETTLFLGEQIRNIPKQEQLRQKELFVKDVLLSLFPKDLTQSLWIIFFAPGVLNLL